MKEARIIMPTAAGVKGAHEVHRQLRHQLVEAFGGFTAVTGEGGWLEDGKAAFLVEDVVIYDVASSKTDAWADQQLISIALDAGAKLRQKAVYVRGFGGTAEIINVRQMNADSDDTPMPALDQLWRTRDRSIVAVYDVASRNSEPYTLKCVVLKPGTAGTRPEYVFVVDKFGKFNPHASSPYSLDLIERVYGY